MALHANRAWVQKELLPFMDKVFTKRSDCAGQSWETLIECAERTYRDHKFRCQYPCDFPKSVETLRLLLVNRDLTTDAERKEYLGHEHSKTQESVRIFVRHAIVHGTYYLVSHGTSPSRLSPRSSGRAMTTLLPFYAKFEEHEMTKEEEAIEKKNDVPAAQADGQEQKRETEAEIGGVQRGQNPGTNGRYNQQPAPNYAKQQPLRHGQQVHQPMYPPQPVYPHPPVQQHVQQQPLRHRQQAQQQVPLHSQHSYTYGHHALGHNIPQGYGYNTHQAHGHHTYQPTLPSQQHHLQPYNNVQHGFHQSQCYPQQTYYAGQRDPQQPGGWYMMQSTVPQMGYANVNNVPQNPGNQMHGWQTAANPNAYHSNFNADAPGFEPQQGRYPNGNA